MTGIPHRREDSQNDEILKMIVTHYPRWFSVICVANIICEHVCLFILYKVICAYTFNSIFTQWYLLMTVFLDTGGHYLLLLFLKFRQFLRSKSIQPTRVIPPLNIKNWREMHSITSVSSVTYFICLCIC